MPRFPWNISYPVVNNEIQNLDWVLNKITEFEEKLNAWSELAEKLLKELEGIEEMKEDILNLQQQVNDLESLRTDLANLKNEVSALSLEVNSQGRDISILKEEMNGINLQFDAVYQRIANEVLLLNQKISGLTIDLENDFNEKFNAVRRVLVALQNEIDNIDTSLINPWHYEEGRVSPDRNNQFVYADLSDQCLTAEEYLKLNLSANDYKKYSLTAINYAKFGKKLLHFDYVFMPLVGVKQEISVVVDSIYNYIMGTMSAEDYELLDLSADDYAALDLSAANYMMYPINQPGLTAADYEGLGTLNSGLIFNFS